ncbi:MAG: thiamine-phosphate kinase [Salinirussus sp.]
MDERAALRRLAAAVPDAGDDAAVIDGLVLTMDMLHERTDFPAGVTRETAGWRAVGASLSDIAAMGAEARATLAAYGAPRLEWDEIADFVDGARAVSESCGAAYVGGDLDAHEEYTVATTAVGRTDDPVRRSGAQVNDAICVTGTLGRTAAALRLFERGEVQRANDLFRFEPRVAAGRALADHATAMMDSSDGLAVSLHQLAEASGVGMAIERPLPIDEVVDEVAEGAADRLELGCYTGEDFELICTVPTDALEAAQAACPVDLTRIGRVVDSDVTLDGESLPERGFTHE